MRVKKAYVAAIVAEAARAETGPPAMVTVDTLLDGAMLCHLMKVSARTLGRLLDETDFPQPLYLTTQIKRWRASEYNAWIDHIKKDGGYVRRKAQRVEIGRRQSDREGARTDHDGRDDRRNPT